MEFFARRGILMTTLGFSGRVRRTRYQITAGAYAPVAPALTAALYFDGILERNNDIIYGIPADRHYTQYVL